MSAWLIAGCALAFGYVPCAIVAARGRLMNCLIAAQLASLLSALILELLGQAFSETFYLDLALAVALLSLPAGIAFVYFYARWL